MPQTMNHWSRLLLLAEILRAYVRTRRLARHADIRDALRDIRARRPKAAAGSMPRSSDEARASAIRLGAAVDRTLRLLPTDSRCLSQSLVLSALLAARGIPSTVAIGARSGPEFVAHAWVEHEGWPLLPSRGFERARLVDI